MPRIALLATLVALLAMSGVALALLVRSESSPAADLKSRSAAAFADSVGVNVHLSYDNTPYSNVRLVIQSLRRAGVHYVRDGLQTGREDQYQALRAVSEAGIRPTLILGEPGKDVADLVDTVREELGDRELALEGPNEFDLSGDDWAEKVSEYQRALRGRLDADPLLRDRPLLGPTVVDSDNRGILGQLRDTADVGNLHPYPGGGPPERALARDVRAYRALFGDRPLQATETGYHNATAFEGDGQPGVSEEIAGDYLPRLYLTAFELGLQRTFWYELVDEFEDPTRIRPDARFGLLRRDFSPKPAFNALTNLMTLVRGESGEVAAQPSAVEIPVLKGVHRLVLRRADGSRLLALWREEPLADTPTRDRLARRPLEVPVTLQGGAGRACIHRPSRSARPVRCERDVEAIDLPVAGDATFLDLR